MDSSQVKDKCIRCCRECDYYDHAQLRYSYPLIRTGDVIPNLDFGWDRNEKECMFCGTSVESYEEHVILRKCKHSLHVLCPVKAMCRYGLTQCGHIHCNICLRFKQEKYKM